MCVEGDKKGATRNIWLGSLGQRCPFLRHLSELISKVFLRNGTSKSNGWEMIMYCGSKHCEKVDFASCCVTYALISALYSHFSLTTLTDGAHGRGKAESQVCLWAVATTHGSGRRAPLFAVETGFDYNRVPNKLSYEKKHDCAGSEWRIMWFLQVCPLGARLDLFWHVLQGRVLVFTEMVHPTGHIYNMHVACRNVYDSLLNIIMAQFVSMN